MCKFVVLLSVLFNLGAIAIAFAEDESGCLVKIDRSLKIDEQCACLKSNSCAKLKKFTMDEGLYGQLDTYNRPLFNNVEKSKMRESIKTYDKIVKLKLAGKGDSDEIKKEYIELDRLNAEVRKSFLKTQAKYLNKSKSVYQKNLEKLNERRKNNFKMALASLNNKPDASKNNLAIEPKEDKVKKNTTKLEIQSKNERVILTAEAIEKMAALDKRKLDNEYILNNLKPDKIQREDNDSLFEIITKSYMKSAYPKLLKSTDLKEE